MYFRKDQRVGQSEGSRQLLIKAIRTHTVRTERAANGKHPLYAEPRNSDARERELKDTNIFFSLHLNDSQAMYGL